MMSLVAFYSLTRMAWNVMSNAVVLLGQNYLGSHSHFLPRAALACLPATPPNRDFARWLEESDLNLDPTY